MKVGFTPKQVIKLTGVPYSTLNLWAKNGLVSPSVAAGTGSGNERVYSFSDVAALKVAFELRKAGVTTRSLSRVIDFVRKHLATEEALVNARLVVSGRDVLLVQDDKHLVSTLSKPGQSCLSFVVDLPRTLADLSSIANTAGTFALGVAEDQERSTPKRKKPSSSVPRESSGRSARSSK